MTRLTKSVLKKLCVHAWRQAEPGVTGGLIQRALTSWFIGLGAEGARRGDEGGGAGFEADEIDPFVVSVEAGALRAEGDARDAGGAQQRGVHPEGRAHQRRGRAERAGGGGAEGLHDGRIGGRFQWRAGEGQGGGALEMRIGGGQGVYDGGELGLYGSGVSPGSMRRSTCSSQWAG
jgi:hypothetical protein